MTAFLSAFLTRRTCFFLQKTTTGQMIYEWEQSLDEVNIYIKPPPGITAAMLEIEIKATHVMVGIKGNPERYLNVSELGTYFEEHMISSTVALPQSLGIHQASCCFDCSIQHGQGSRAPRASGR
jgi:hypothetical protein